MNTEDTIAAIATPVGEGGIGVVRISGPRSRDILADLFLPASGKREEPESHRVYYGALAWEGEVIDRVMAVYLQAPRTYTRQDTVEISCHGSPPVLRRALKAVIAHGARMAEPGEFTKRAFLNGRIDLSQAEGVIDLIKARSEGAARAALNLMEGGLSTRINAVKERLVRLLSQLEASIDFPDEELEETPDATLLAELEDVINRMASLIKSYEAGRFLKHGMGLAIIGKPNVGKSSLLNALLEEERAIVTPVPGTTRDLIKAETEIAGLPVELIDTAGLNENPDQVEAIGIEWALKAAQTADVVLAMFDGSRAWEEADQKVLDTLKEAKLGLAVINKSDLPQELVWPDDAIQPTTLSVNDRTGIHALLEEIQKVALSAGDATVEEPLVTRTRHLDIFKRILADLERAREELAVGREVAAAEVWDALEEIKRFTGESYTDEVIAIIFDEFCIGK